ncbi:MAG: hypothetical protein FD130_970 [Halothiobacillaceae bacterium]|nr:MAG: hypothetical protein FD130_970 [Halothiobacillaceae bacterium]
MKSLLIIVICTLTTLPTLAANRTIDRPLRILHSTQPNPIKPITLGEEHETLGGSVSRATFTRAVVNYEPVDQITHVTNMNHIYFFTELKGFMGRTVFHRWFFNGAIVREDKFEVGGPRWRIWSSTTILPNLLGQWRVEVVDITGKIIREAIFDYVPSLVR